MRFIDSYKRLEKLCSEMYGNTSGVSSYIDDMKGTPIGARYVAGWEEDLKRLKHYRWVRNQISHVPGCTEENMCEPGDDLWLDNFHSRIMSGTDPLTLYREATEPKRVQRPKQTYTPPPRLQTKPQYTKQPPKQPPKQSAGCFTVVLCVALVVIAAVVLLSII